MEENIIHEQQCEFNQKQSLEYLHCKRCQTTINEDHDCFIHFKKQITNDFDMKLLQFEHKLTQKIKNKQII